MAVEDKYINTLVAAGKPDASAFVTGAKTVCMVATFEVAVADDDGSVYRLFKNVPAHLVPTKIEIFSDAITAGTDWDLGLYESFDETASDGIVVDKDVLADGIDLSSGSARGSAKDGLVTVAIDAVQSSLMVLAGHTTDYPYTKKLGYDIALTANTVGSAAGTISVVAWFVQA